MYVLLVDVSQDTTSANEYPGLYRGSSGPTVEVASRADSPLSLLKKIPPHHLWKKIAVESNRYYAQKVNDKAVKVQERQRARARVDPTQPVQSRKEIRAKIREVPRFEAHEY